ncbi:MULTISPECIES: conjugal transfer protein TraD [Acidithiobacillus]|uniref:conjugal transfer protein TraD n=1 Tax=Acidithiobacillus TaxID=119977 RepID=UPI0020CAB77B|nr:MULTISPECIES: conjugal transfer protein TraD [Acidithiobacillus]
MARKARNHALFKVGGLVELAGLLECDKGALLGGLLETAETWRDGPESPRFQEWKQSGDALLAEREAERKSNTKKTAESETTVSEAAETHSLHGQP